MKIILHGRAGADLHEDVLFPGRLQPCGCPFFSGGNGLLRLKELMLRRPKALGHRQRSSSRRLNSLHARVPSVRERAPRSYACTRRQSSIGGRMAELLPRRCNGLGSLDHHARILARHRRQLFEDVRAAKR
ncbi:Histone-lysine N-methyltransferase MLL2 [Hordeum vulgare]|nr:Histone-lysine N-methyltransferase MLL2 [Hordeum vulgare]